MLIQYATKIQCSLLNRCRACDEADIISYTVVNDGKLLKKFYFGQGANATTKQNYQNLIMGNIKS